MKAIAQRQLLEVTRVDWETPQWLFDELHAEYDFTVDVCATANNAKCDRFWTMADDGLRQDWSGERCWMNPPYGREIARWVQRAALSDSLVVGLLPARTDTAWWHEYVIDHEVRFLRGRLKFGRAGRQSAPFPSAVVVWGDA